MNGKGLDKEVVQMNNPYFCCKSCQGLIDYNENELQDYTDENDIVWKVLYCPVCGYMNKIRVIGKFQSD